jgi:hypothetical protein
MRRTLIKRISYRFFFSILRHPVTTYLSSWLSFPPTPSQVSVIVKMAISERQNLWRKVRKQNSSTYIFTCVCVCVCVRERERERERTDCRGQLAEWCNIYPVWTLYEFFNLMTTQCQILLTSKTILECTHLTYKVSFQSLREVNSIWIWFQASAALFVTSALFWGVTQRRMVILYRRFGTTYRSHLLELL